MISKFVHLAKALVSRFGFRRSPTIQRCSFVIASERGITYTGANGIATVTDCYFDMPIAPKPRGLLMGVALTCLLIIAIPMTAHANYAFIGSGHNAANGNTITYSPTAGNYLVVGAFTSAGAGSPTASIADNGTGSAWTTQSATTTFASSFFTFFSGVAGTGVTTITLTFAGGTPGSVILGVVEYSGLSATGWQAISAGNLQAVPGSPAGTGTNAVTSNALTVSAQPAVLIGWVFELGGNGGGTAGTSPIAFTRRLNIGGIMTEDARVTATGSVVGNATNSNGSVDSLVTYAFAITEGGGGGGGSGNQPLALTGVAAVFRQPAANDPRMAMDRLILPHFKKVA